MTKKIFDFFFSIFFLIIFSWLLIICVVLSSLDTNSFGIFTQKRIGRFGKPFIIYKIKTVHDTTKKISAFGKFLRKTKLDELPQLYNILKGEMSFVGPRPDIAGYYDKLEGEDRKVLELKPGLTSAASIKYRNEERMLLQKENPLEYNDTVIFPDKVKINRDYQRKQSLWVDLKIMVATFTGKY